MTILAVLLELPESPEVLLEGHHIVLAGFVLVVLGAVKALLGRKKVSLGRTYHLWLLLGSGVCLIALGFAIGESPDPFLDLAR